MKKHVLSHLRMWTLLGLFLFPALSHHVEAKKPKIQGTININTASQEQLRLLHRIGPKMALRIIRYRLKKKFVLSSDLMKVRGIGPKTFKKLRAYISTKKPTKFKVLSR